MGTGDVIFLNTSSEFFILFDIGSSFLILRCVLEEPYNSFQTTDYENINELILVMINNEII